MPMSRLSLLRGKSADYLQAVQAGLHRALVEAFEVPEADRFQVLEQLDPGALVFDRDYLGGPRSDDFVLITVTAGRPRSTETKQRFFRQVVDNLSDNPGVRPQDVMIVITTTGTDDWSFSDGIGQIMPGVAR